MEASREEKAPLGVTDRNLVGERVKRLREGFDVEGNPRKGRAALKHGELAGELVDAILEVAPKTAPVRRRRWFSRTDVIKIESGSRYVRDYELLALAQVFDVSVQELLGLPADGKVPAPKGERE